MTYIEIVELLGGNKDAWRQRWKTLRTKLQERLRQRCVVPEDFLEKD